ncbi:TSPEAR [Symbiodinium sp. CCMP2456]|nr:TSPEAR [Symbiodinium sp. CCMP2456]
MVCQSHRFVELQEILTNAARWWEPFSMDGVQYLAVANDFDGSSVNIDSKIYRWDDARSVFLEMQSIPTKAAQGITAFAMNGIQHLAVANHHDGSSSNVDSKLYRWDDANSTFFEMQSIPTKGATDITAFSMNGIQHLAVANHYDDSKLYRWDDANSTFFEMQSIPTKGATGVTAFSMNGIQHLAVANYVDDSGSLNIDSKIYRWDDAKSTFLEMQSVPTKGARCIIPFSMNGIQHLAVANFQDSTGSGNIDSEVYRWDDARSVFLGMQSIPTKGAFSFTAFSMDGIQHLVVASYSSDSEVYRWDDASSTFLEMQSIPTKGAHGWAAFAMNGIQHLAVANSVDGGSYTTYSKVYIWATSTTTTSTITSTTTITTTRTEAPSVLAATDFAFEDVRSWSLAALGGYLVALSVPIFMAKMCEQAGSRARQSIGESQIVGSSIEEAAEDPGILPGSVVQADAASATEAVPGTEATQSEGTPLAQAQGQAAPQKFLPSLGLPKTFTGARQIMNKSPYILAVKMLLESGNLLSTMLYAMEAHQRAILVGFSAQCGEGTLMPLKISECRSWAETAELAELPACAAFLGVNALCEADAEADDGSCMVPKELDNCGDFDVYKMQQLACGAIGCKALSHILWIAALMSFGATVAWNAGFYARSLHRLQREEARRLCIRFKALFAFLAVLLVTTTLVGFAGGSGAVLAMALLCPLLPVCAWVLAAWLASLPTKGKEAIVNQAAALELPIFNVFVALNLSEKDVEALNSFRIPLNMGLRVMEDVPELIIGLLDLVYFGGSWYAWFGILMSMAMLVFDLLLSALLQCQQSAMKIARKTVDTE